MTVAVESTRGVCEDVAKRLEGIVQKSIVLGLKADKIKESTNKDGYVICGFCEKPIELGSAYISPCGYPYCNLQHYVNITED